MSDLTLSQLFIGQLANLPGDGTPTGMYKHPVAEAWADLNGLRGDVQADRRFHGGPDKALHHYPAEHYPRLAAQAPAAVQSASTWASPVSPRSRTARSMPRSTASSNTRWPCAARSRP